MRMPRHGAHLSAVVESVLAAVGQVELVAPSRPLLLLGQTTQHLVEVPMAGPLEKQGVN